MDVQFKVAKPIENLREAGVDFDRLLFGLRHLPSELSIEY